MLVKSSIWCKLFQVRNLEEISRISKNIENLKMLSMEALLLYDLSEREPGWRLTARCHTEPRWIGLTKIRNFGRHFHVFNDLVYYELLVCYIQTLYIMKFNFLWVWASVLDGTLVFNSWMDSPKLWKNDEISEFLWQIKRKTAGFGNLYVISSPWRKF